MSGPAGSDSSSKLAGLVSRLRKNPKERSAASSQDDSAPSKKLPPTGLKRNTEEWRQAHKDELKGEENRPKNSQGRSKKGGGWGRHDSSSSIPDNATADGEEERPEDQEGAEGRGPGRHEPRLGNDIPMTDSPAEEDGLVEKYEDILGPAISVSIPSGATAQDGEAKSGFTLSETNGARDVHNPNGHSGSNGFVHGGSNTNHEIKEGIDEQPRQQEEEFLQEERAAKHDSERNRKLTDEMGNRPDTLPAVKDEERPGPRNEIVLDPRVVHMHVSLHQCSMTS